MSVFDATAVDMASRAPGGAADQAPAAGGEKPPVPADTKAGTKAAEKKDDDAAAASGKPATTEAITTILEKHGLESPEQLGEFIDGLAGIKGQLGDVDLAEIMKSHETLQAYRKEWAKQERLKQKENEQPEDTIARLERELEDRDAQAAKGEKERKEAEAAKRHIAEFNSTITSGIEADEAIPAEYRPFLSALMGVKNPVNDVDIQDKAAVRKVLKTFGAKMVKDFEQTVIKRYRDGKEGLPPTPPPGGDATPVTTEAKPKNLSEARTLAHASLRALLGKR
jgi:hypothetical protein